MTNNHQKYEECSTGYILTTDDIVLNPNKPGYDGSNTIDDFITTIH